MTEELRKSENARMMCVFLGGSLKASLTRVFSLAKNEQAMTQMDNCGECDLGFNPHQEHYRQVNLPSVLSSPDGEGNGINSITNLSPLAKVAFTMAEILLSLTIIGVVAAITLPSLIGNINERTWNTQRKVLYSRMSQAISLMPSLNGYGVLQEIENEDGTKTIEDTATETFLTAGLSKVLKINNICDNEHFSDCGIPNKILPVKGDALLTSSMFKTLVSYNAMFNGSYNIYKYSQIDTKAMAFETLNGESIITFYNPYCSRELKYGNLLYSQRSVCVNFVYDLNGKRGPNKMGKDVGYMTALYPTDPLLINGIIPLGKMSGAGGFPHPGAWAGRCRNQFGDEAKVATIQELSALFTNRELLVLEDMHTWSSTKIDVNTGYTMYLAMGFWGTRKYTDNTNVLCVKEL